MARPLRIEFENAFYHIIQRGIERKNIFVSDTDKNKFLSYLDFCCTAYGAVMHAYVLMNNHYHIILETPRANLTKVIHYLNASYAAKGFILGNDDFAENIINAFVIGEQDSEIPIINELKRRKEPSLEQIKTLVEENIKNDRRLQRRVSLYLSRKHTQKTLNDIAVFYSKIKDTGVSQAFRRTENARGEGKALEGLLVKLEKKLKVQSGDLTP